MKRKPAPTHRAALPGEEYTALRAKVLARDGWRCAVPWCRRVKGLQVDHVIPRSAGAADDPANLVTLCFWDHAAKHDGRLQVGVKLVDGKPEFSFEDLRPRPGRIP